VGEQLLARPMMDLMDSFIRRIGVENI